MIAHPKNNDNVLLRATTLVLFVFLTAALPAQEQPTLQTVTVPGSNISFQMALLPSAQFNMGSPVAEAGRDEDEGQHLVTLDSFWIGIHELTFDAFFLTHYLY